MKNWFSKDKSGKTSESETVPDSSHPDEARLVEPPRGLRASRELSQGELLAASIQAQAMEADVAQRKVPGAKPGAPVREEAAALYAAGRAQDAAKALTSSMQASRGQVDRRIWYMLFDLYQSTDQHAAFERLALLFARAFNASPPAWESWSASPASMLGRNVLVVDGHPSGMNPDKVAGFLSSARQVRQARLDLSRTQLEDTEAAVVSIDRLLSLMARLRRYRVRTLLMGETRLVDELRQLIQMDLPQSPSAWLLLFEIMQWRGDEQQFDTLALEYAAKFERSPPGFEPDGIVALNPDDAQDQAQASQITALLVPPDHLTSANIEGFLSQVDERLRRFGTARLDMSRLRVLSFDAATSLAGFLSALGVSRGRVMAVKPTELVLAILEMSGAMPYLGMEPRKR